MLPRPFNKRHFDPADPLQRFAGQVAFAFPFAVRVQTALTVRSVQHILQHTGVQIPDTLRTDHRQDVIAPELLYLICVAAARSGLRGDQEFCPDIRTAFSCIRDALIQPSVRFPVRFPLAGSARLCTGEGPAHAVLLHFDLPALLIWQPCGCIRSSGHVHTSIGTL